MKQDNGYQLPVASRQSPVAFPSRVTVYPAKAGRHLPAEAQRRHGALRGRNLLASINTVLLLLFLVATYNLSAQSNFPAIKSPDKGFFRFPWAGGMNSIQYNEIDIDCDGTNDLLAFDRQGNRLMPFINKGIPNTIDYSFAPEHISSFPEITSWLLITDYNLDGKNDIFTYNYSDPGIMVYKNISNTSLKFELIVYPYLTSFYGSGYVNILVTYADFPAITDLDNDGDLDILTFWALGSFIELHVNQSMEKYGIPDSLDFIRTEYCWGHFAESEESNVLYLDTCFGVKPPQTNFRDRHTGSTFLVTDLNGDNTKDLLLGDVDYPTLAMLINGNTSIDAYMSSYTYIYPPYTFSVDLFSMPLARYIDVNNDGLKDLLVSPFDPNPFVSRNYYSNWLYLNSGQNNQPAFTFSGSRFLQEEMIDVGSGAYPVFFDIDSDGLQDMFTGNYGYYDSSYYDNIFILHSVYTGKLGYFKNTGTTTHPEFEFINNNYAGISWQQTRGVYPTFGDIDNDGDADLISGKEDGKLLYYRNEESQGSPGIFTFISGSYQGIDVGEFSTPQLFDLDNDQLLDLIIGEMGGNLNYYRNTGSVDNPVFILETDSLGKVNVTDYNVSNFGFSTPYLFNNGNDVELLSGSEQGKIFYFKKVRQNLTGEFPESDSLFALINDPAFTVPDGYRTSAAITDLDKNGYFDLVIGNFSGGLQYFADVIKPPVNQDIVELDDKNEINIYPNPCKENLTINSETSISEIKIYNQKGKIIYQSKPKESLIRINTKHYYQGLYFVKIKSEKNLLIGKFVVLK